MLRRAGRLSLIQATVVSALAIVGCASAKHNSAPPVTEISTPAATTAPSPSPVASDAWQVAGTSVQGRPIRLKVLGHGPRKVLFVGGIHGDEAEGAYMTAALPAAFIDRGLSDSVTLTVLEDANPDGRAAGTRGNANGVDINRNFPASNFDTTNPANGGLPLSQPESRILYDTIGRIGPDLILVAHSWTGQQFINFDGPAREVAERFSAVSGLRVETSSEFAPTPGSLGSYVGRDRGIPILTIEVLKGSDPKAVWDKVGAALLQAIGG